MERTYRLHQEKARIDDAARASMTTEDHRRAFTAFTASLLAEFDRYLAGNPTNPTADGVTYQQSALWLTDDEMAALLDEMRAAVISRMDNDPAPGSVRRLVSLIGLPADPGVAEVF